jgi:tRNA(Ile)-lysidine synthase
MTTYIVAVSGGVDSVSLLHMLHRVGGRRVVVAHFDHGIRPDSAEDAHFVKRLAHRYGYPYETARVDLGPGASEDRARQQRYKFLRWAAEKHGGVIVTAHHADDVVETAAINLYRGTGWRGLATHGADISRPLLNYTKAELLAYAQRHGLEWREDSTNKDEAYLRNRLRKLTRTLSDDEKRQILALRSHQLEAKRQIEAEVKRLIGLGPLYQRYFFTHVPRKVALECLRVASRGRLTRPQLERALLMIKTAQPGAKYQAGSGATIDFTSRNFSLSLVK